VILTLPLEETCYFVELIFRESGKNLGRCVHITPKDGSLVFYHAEGESVAVDIHVLIRKVNAVMRRNVAEQEQWTDQIVKVEALSRRKDSRIKGTDAVRFIPNKIRKSVGSGCVDEAVANPLARFHAVVVN
jgi:hypothetical protein